MTPGRIINRYNRRSKDVLLTIQRRLIMRAQKVPLFNDKFFEPFGRIFNDFQDEADKIFRFRNQYSSFEQNDKGLTIQYSIWDSAGKRDDKKIFIPTELLNAPNFQETVNELAAVEVKRLAEIKTTEKEDRIKELEAEIARLKS